LHEILNTLYRIENKKASQETSYKSLDESLALIEQAVSGEREAELFYDYLVSVAPTTEFIYRGSRESFNG
jgi:rubrerythrin